MRANKLKCVLLVDDDGPTNYLNRFILEQTEITSNIETAQSVNQALDLLDCPLQADCKVPDLIFLDINMPGLTGWDFIEAYREKKARKKNQSVIIMLTTSANPDDEMRAKTTACISGFCQKPLTMEVIDEIMEQHFACGGKKE
ncbi:MAG: response regulator with CheY-like receiver, AAA-type ATPase, and DNA-binding domain [Bacteroidetes bacterium]|nr:MAG: response regulator with CheY-like receiver, AAA-type ATPase, and DNA-binding domain [Bacteroidota bacterium]